MVDRTDGDHFDGTRDEMDRAIRRLDTLEWMILGFAILVALLGGAGVAFLVAAGTGLPFRPTWAVVAILLLGVPGAFVFGREFLFDKGSPDRTNDGPESASPDPRPPR